MLFVFVYASQQFDNDRCVNICLSHIVETQETLVYLTIALSLVWYYTVQYPHNIYLLHVFSIEWCDEVLMQVFVF